MPKFPELLKLSKWLRSTGAASRTYENLPMLLEEAAKHEVLKNPTKVKLPDVPEFLLKPEKLLKKPPLDYPSGGTPEMLDAWRKAAKERSISTGIGAREVIQPPSGKEIKLSPESIEYYTEKAKQENIIKGLKGNQDITSKEQEDLVNKMIKSGEAFDKTKTSGLAAAGILGASVSKDAQAEETNNKFQGLPNPYGGLKDSVFYNEVPDKYKEEEGVESPELDPIDFIPGGGVSKFSKLGRFLK